IQKAYDDPEFAEDVFYPVIAFAKGLENKYYFNEREFSPVRELYSEYPEIGTWNYRPASRMHDALIYLLNPDSYAKSNGYSELEQTLPFRIVKGEKVFSDHLRATQGVRVRVSSSGFIEKCLVFCSGFRLDELKGNFDVEKMAELGIYKVGESCEYHYVENYFVELTDFYNKIASLENVSVFISED
ncbi:MAG: DUF1877 family protein, partial [Kangiellaceae bacterium]